MFLTRIFYALACACLLLPQATVADSSTTPSIDPALPVFIQQVWSESPELRGTQAKMDAAQASTDGADLPIHNPSLEIEAERTNINTSSIGFSQTFDWSDKQGALVTIARWEQQAAQAAFRETRRNTALEALNLLVDYFTAHEIQMLAERRTQLMQVLVNAVKQRQTAGDVSPLDVTLAQVTYSEALISQAKAQSTLAEIKAELLAVNGMTQLRENTKWPEIPAKFSTPPSDLKGIRIETLPMLTLLRNRVAVAKARINLAKKEGRIDPTLGIRVGKEDRETLVGLSLEIPLFVRNNYEAAAREASHQAVAEEQTYRDAHRRATVTLRSALARHQNTFQAWRTWRAVGHHAQREQMSLLEQLWQAGELSVTDYLIQAKQNIDTQEAATLLLGDTRRSHFAWLAASNRIEAWLGLSQHNIEKNSGEQK